VREASVLGVFFTSDHGPVGQIIEVASKFRVQMIHRCQTNQAKLRRFLSQKGSKDSQYPATVIYGGLRELSSPYMIHLVTQCQMQPVIIYKYI